MIIEVGFYDNPKAVGFLGWIKSPTHVTFVDFDGSFFGSYDV